MISGLVLKQRKGERWVSPKGYVDALPASSQFLLIEPTCSILPEENEAQVAAFLAAHPTFHVLPLSEAAPHLTAAADSDYLSLTPARHGTDDFFAAVQQRKAAVAEGS